MEPRRRRDPSFIFAQLETRRSRRRGRGRRPRTTSRTTCRASRGGASRVAALATSRAALASSARAVATSSEARAVATPARATREHRRAPKGRPSQPSCGVRRSPLESVISRPLPSIPHAALCGLWALHAVNRGEPRPKRASACAADAKGVRSLPLKRRQVRAVAARSTTGVVEPSSRVVVAGRP